MGRIRISFIYPIDIPRLTKNYGAYCGGLGVLEVRQCVVV